MSRTEVGEAAGASPFLQMTDGGAGPWARRPGCREGREGACALPLDPLLSGVPTDTVHRRPLLLQPRVWESASLPLWAQPSTVSCPIHPHGVCGWAGLPVPAGIREKPVLCSHWGGTGPDGQAPVKSLTFLQGLPSPHDTAQFWWTS